MKSNSTKILVIVPAYNEENNIQQVIGELHASDANMQIFVVNDGSKDNTQANAESSNAAKVAKLINNLGIGGAVQTGFKFAVENDFDIAIQFDGDGQHIASEISKILKPIVDGKCDICIGSRFVEKTVGFQSTFFRRIGIKVFFWLTRLLIAQAVSDSTSGFRAYNRSAVAFLAENYPSDFPEPESIILLGRKGFRISEVSVEMRARQGGTSSIAGVKSAHYMLKVILSMLMTAWRTEKLNK